MPRRKTPIRSLSTKTAPKKHQTLFSAERIPEKSLLRNVQLALFGKE